MSTEMSSRERMLAALKREPHDRVPFSPYLNQGPVWKDWLFYRNQFERAEVLLGLGLDPTITVWLPDVCPAREVEVRSRRERKGGEVLLTKEYETPSGVLRTVVGETEDWCDPAHAPLIPGVFGTEVPTSHGLWLMDDWAVSRRAEPWVKGPDDLEKLRWLIRVPTGGALDDWRQDTERAVEFARKHDLLVEARRTTVGDAFQWFCDIPWFLMQLIDDPGFVDAFFGVFQDWAKAQLELALEYDVDLVQYRGWYEIPSMFGPQLYERFLRPLVTEQAEMVRAAGKLAGYLLPEGQGAYADMLADMPIDVNMGVDPKMLHGGDLRSLFAKLGGHQSFWGGVNAEVDLNVNDPARIEREVQHAIEELGGNNGLVLSAFLFPSVPQPAVKSLIEAWRKHA